VILVVSFPDNPHVSAVLRHLTRPFTVFDVAEFPDRARLSARFGPGEDGLTLTAEDGRLVDAADLGAVWFRRIRPMTLDAELTDPVGRLFAWSESTEALTGFWHSTECFWMNPPAADEVGQRKIRQLQVARQVGLTVPDTLITNDPAQAREFVAARLDRGVVRKAFRNIAEAPRTTALLGPADLDRMPQVRFAPVTFQEFVPAELDLRVIVVEDEIFAAAIRSQPEYRADYRPGSGTAEVRAHRLSDDVADRLLALHKRLGLVYGASDLRLTPDGDYVFLEVNPAGEFLFACERTGQPVPQAIAAALARHDRASVG